eukprot:764919-Rhodomonas_salina.1
MRPRTPLPEIIGTKDEERHTPHIQRELQQRHGPLQRRAVRVSQQHVHRHVERDVGVHRVLAPSHYRDQPIRLREPVAHHRGAARVPHHEGHALALH